ncbi:hypothetical protein T4A_8729 [Trichinella pseudospiralis]|uniref:Uncharacterized protein n=1 Tax=Trichinella pseudospiralis TaxID=6337 RepID=A0A0V1DSW6_TRIPS|nr:hypothetical protein T4A_8729 [Trichinella pseudospiralis]
MPSAVSYQLLCTHPFRCSVLPAKENASVLSGTGQFSVWSYPFVFCLRFNPFLVFVLPFATSFLTKWRRFVMFRALFSQFFCMRFARPYADFSKQNCCHIVRPGLIPC